MRGHHGLTRNGPPADSRERAAADLLELPTSLPLFRFRRSASFVRLAVGFLACAVSLSCSDLLNARPLSARVVLVPQFSERDAAIYRSLPTFNLGVTSVHIQLRRPGTAEILKDTTVAMAEGQDSIAVTFDVPIQGSEEVLNATLEMSSGGILLFTGTQTVVARVAGNVISRPPPLVPIWVGPGANATSVNITPDNPTTGVAGQIQFSATAVDGSGTPITNEEYTSRFRWKVTDATLGAINSAGLFVGAGVVGTTKVVVLTPNLLADTVTVSLVGQTAPVSAKFARALEVINVSGASTVPITVKDAQGTTISTPSMTYTSRTPAIATVNATTGAITGVAAGQAIIVASVNGVNGVADSLIAGVTNGGPVLYASMPSMRISRDSTMTVSIFVDMRQTTKKLGSTTIDVDWNPSQLQFQSSANGASGVTPTVNANATSTGRLTLAMADVAGFNGLVELLKITFKTSSSASTGALTLTAREMNAALDYSDMLGVTVMVTHPLVIP